MSSASAIDVLLSGGQIQRFNRLASGAAVIAQRVRARTLTHRGEWPLDTSVGIPWTSYLGGKPFNVEGLIADLATTWQATPGVAEVVSIDATQSGGTVTITAELRTVTGETLYPSVQAPGVDGNPSVVVGGLLAASGLVAA